MVLPAVFHCTLRLPAIAAPMFLVSGPGLVAETCKASGDGVIAGGIPLAQDAYKQMLVEAAADAISGTNANFLWPSLETLGRRREELVQGVGKGKPKALGDEAEAWRDVWSAGHGVATIHDVPPVAELCGRLAAEYRVACALPTSPAPTG